MEGSAGIAALQRGKERRVTRLLAIVRSDAWKSDAPLGARESTLFFVSVAVLYGAAAYLHLEFLLGLAIIGLGVGFLILRNEFLWIVAVIIGYLPVFWKTTDEFTPVEISQAVLFYGGLVWWFYRRIFIMREPIRWSAGGILFTAFFLYAMAMLPLSFMNEADPVFVARESAVLGSTLLFIPIRHVFTTPLRQRLLLILLLGIVAPIAVKNMMEYQQKVISAVAYWEIGASRKTESYFLFFVTATISFALLVSERKALLWFTWAGYFLVSIGAAILSFYRSIWATIIFGLGIMGLCLGMPYWRKAAGYGLAGISGAMIVVSIVFSATYALDIIGTSIADRFLSFSKYQVDPSLINRNVEAGALIDQTGMHLIVGHGLSSRVVFRNYITHHTVRSTWSHNGYAWLIHHFGLIGALLLIGAYMTYMFKAWALQWKLRQNSSLQPYDRYRWRSLLSACAAIGAGFLLVSVTSNQFLVRDAALAISIVWGMTDLWEEQLRSVTNPTTFPVSA